ncbi:flavoprotein [Pseudonocardia sp. CA-107938]|uniref:flavoprotein n=1 Tax=Pseudonocardia sp. CA-107938 TaxID=3240021 RepID=UPI003D90C37C
MRPALTLVVCGAPLAARSAEVATALADRGWSVTTVVSPSALQWRSAPPVAARTPRPATVLALPLTFNSANKVAAGIMDTRTCGALCDALGAGVPVFAVAMVNDRLWGHPVWSSTLRALTGAGVRWLDPLDGPVDRPAAVPSGTGDELVRSFDPVAIAAAIVPGERSVQAP